MAVIHRDPIPHSTPKQHGTVNQARDCCMVFHCTSRKIPLPIRWNGICVNEAKTFSSPQQNTDIAPAYSNRTMNWLGVPSRIMRMCCSTGWQGATKFKMSWQLSVAGTENRHKVFDRPLCISMRSLKEIWFDWMVDGSIAAHWLSSLTYSCTCEWYLWWPQQMDFPKRMQCRPYGVRQHW